MAWTLKADALPKVRGRYSEDAALGEVGWFRCGGRAEILFRPADRDDLAGFLATCPPEIPVRTLGVLSNTIVRDGGVPGVTIRLGREFTGIEVIDRHGIRAGAAALDINVAQVAAENGIGGLEFLSGIPGSIGGACRMNGGAYGVETKDVLVSAEIIDRQGLLVDVPIEAMGLSYRHCNLAEGIVFTAVRLQGLPDEPSHVQEKINQIKAKREASQPVRERTGGSTFANPGRDELEKAGLPPDTGSWQLIDRVGGRGYRIGGAKMSEKHCNFMINTGTATATDLETLGEEMRRRVADQTGIDLRWEIRRIGLSAIPQGTTGLS